MFGLGTMELVLIFLVVVIIFGVGKLPEIGSGLGKAINGFKKGVSNDEVLKANNDNAKEKA
ncbi:MAG: twin-arginine translocase TatA/TatE family subunit [Deltaproteobacteria bacterium]|nr:twin-arginine translocase TatA/TatE family subunit [Deltaproteobacteria bacterium]